MITNPSATSAYCAPSANPWKSSCRNLVIGCPPVVRSVCRTTCDGPSKCTQNEGGSPVEPFDEVVELLRDGLALHLLRRGQLALFGVELLGQQGEALDGLHLSQLLAHLLHPLVDQLVDLGLLAQVA